MDNKVVFKQKITRDHGREPILVDREAEILRIVPEEEKPCSICGVGSKNHSKKRHTIKTKDIVLVDLKIKLPKGPEYDPWLGKLDPGFEEHIRQNVEFGTGPNQWCYIDDKRSLQT